MNHSETDVALVEKYFDEGLSHSEKQYFDVKVNSDDNFKALVEHERILIGAIRQHGLGEDLQYLKSLETTLGDQKVIPMHTIQRKWYYAAAAATILTLAIVGKILLTPSVSTDKLFQAYYQPYPNVFEPTVRGESKASDRKEAFQAYEQGDYSKAVILFNDLLKEKKEPGLLLLVGNANLMLGNIEEAKGNFITLNSDFDELDIQSKWFLSLCYLKGGDLKNATPLLQELGNSETSYAIKAQELLKEVK